MSTNMQLNMSPAPGGAFSNHATRLAQQASPVRTLKEDHSIPDAGDALNIQMSKVHPRAEVGIKVTRRVSQTFQSPEVHTDHLINPNSNQNTKMQMHQPKGYMMSDRSIDQSAMLKQIHNVAIGSVGEAIDATKSVQYKAAMQKQTRENYLTNLYDNTVGSKTNLLQKHFNKDITTMYFSMREQAGVASPKRMVGTLESQNNFETADNKTDKDSETQGGRDEAFKMTDHLKDLKNPRVDLSIKSIKKAPLAMNQQKLTTAPMSPISPYSHQFSTGEEPPQSSYLNRDQITSIDSRAVLETLKMIPSHAGQCRNQPLALPKLEGEQINLLNRQMYPSPVADSLKRIRSPPGPYDSIRLNSCSRNQYSFENSANYKAEIGMVPPITTRLHQVSLRSGSNTKNNQGAGNHVWGLRSSDTTTDNQLTIKNFNQRKPFAVELQQNKQEFASNRVGLRTRGPQYYDQLLKSHDGVLLMSKSGEKHLTQVDAYGGLVSEDHNKKIDVQYSAQFGSGEFINNEQQFLVKVQPLDSRGNKQTGQLFPDESPRYHTESVKVDSAGGHAPQNQTHQGIFAIPSSQPNKMSSKNQRVHRGSNHIFSADKKQRQKTVGPAGLSIQHRYKRPDRFHIESIAGPNKDTLQLSFREETTSHPQTQRDHITNTTERSVHLPMSARMNESIHDGAIASQNQSTSAIDYQLSLNKHSPFGPVSPDGNMSPRTANRQSDQCFPTSPKRSMLEEHEAPTLQSSVLTSDERRQALNQVQSTKSVPSSKNPLNGKAFHQVRLPTMANEDMHAVRRKQNEQLTQAIKQIEQQIKQRRRDVAKQAEKTKKGRRVQNKQIKLHDRIQMALEQQMSMRHQSGSFESRAPGVVQGDDSLFDEVTAPLIEQSVSDNQEMRNSFPEINEPPPLVETREMNQTGQHPNLRSFGEPFAGEEGSEQFNTPQHNQQHLHPSLNINQLGDSTTLFKAIDSNASMNNFGRTSNISSQLVQVKGLDPDNSDLNRLYRVKFQQDMDNVKLRTQEQILSNKTLKDNYDLKVEYFRAANLQLARSIKTIKELADKQQMDRQKKDAAEQRRLYLEGAGMCHMGSGPAKKTFEENNDQGVGENAETVSVGTGSLMGHSSFSPGRKPKGGASDIKRVEKIIMHVPQIMNSKKPIDGILAALKTMKAALGKVCSKLTLFIADKPLQRLIFQGTARMQRYYKTLSLENKPYYGIYLDESDYAAPTFSTEKQARVVQLQPSVIQLPFFDRDGGLQMIFQAIQDQSGPANKSRLNSKARRTGEFSQRKSHMSGKESQTNRNSVLSHGSGSNKQKRWFPGFAQSDFLIARIIAMMSKININIFENRYYAREKTILQKKLLQFTNGLLRKKTVKEVIRMIKTEIPALLGYKQCQVFVGAKENHQMYTVSVEKDESEVQEKVFCGIPMHYIEQEYVCPENRVVRFPENLGYSGYAYTRNSILFINDFSYKLEKNVTQLIGMVPAYQKYLFTRVGFAFVGGLMARDVNYASKIDNFIEYKNIRNFLFSSLEDETFVGYPKPVGVIQLYDRKEKNIDYEDYARVFYMRKLLGSVLVRGGEYTEALQTLLGFGLNPCIQKALTNGARQLNDDYATTHESSAQHMGMTIQYMKKTFTDQHKLAEPVIAELEALAEQKQKVARSRSPIKTEPLEDKDKEKTVEQ